MNKDELIELVKKIKLVEGTEEEVDEMIKLFLKNVPDPNAANLIFWQELTPEEVVDKALSYRPFLL
jgi:hypothetical protein